MSFSGAMPFSRASAVIASRISRDIRVRLLGLDEVGSEDGVVRDGGDAAACGDRHLRVRRADELAGERLVTVELLARTHAGAAPDERAEVRRLGERPLRAGRRDGQRVVLADLWQRVRDALA